MRELTTQETQHVSGGDPWAIVAIVSLFLAYLKK